MTALTLKKRLSLKPSLGLGKEASGGMPVPPSGFLIVRNDDGSYEVDDNGLIYISEAA